MLIGDMIREYKIAEEALKEKEEELVEELNTILKMLPFNVMDSEQKDHFIDYFYIDKCGQVRINWGF